MSDPTHPAIATSFLVTLVASAICVGRKLATGRRDEAPPPLGGGVATGIYRQLDLAGPVLLLVVFFGLFLANATAGKANPTDYTAPALVFSIAFQFMVAGGVSATVLSRISADRWLGLRWHGWPWVFVIAPLCVMGMWAVLMALELAGYSRMMQSLGVDTVQDTVQVFRDSEDPLVIGLMVVAAVVVAPLCEEVVFRGYLYPVMKRFAGMLPALVCSSLFFATVHNNLAVLMPLFLLSIVLTVAYEKTGSIWAPIAIHGCFNLATVSWQLWLRLHPVESTLSGP